MTQPQSIGGFFSGGSKSFSWKDKPLGTVCEGTILEIHPPQQATDPVDGTPVFNKKTQRPKMQVRIDLQTNERDPQDPDDDGRRGLYVGGWMQGAVGDALRKAGAPNNEPQVGGYLWVQLTERQPNDVPALAPINKFVAQYRLAPVTAGYFNQEVPQQAPPLFVQPQQQFGIAGQGLPGIAPQLQQAFTAPPLQSPVEDAPPWAQPAQQVAPQGSMTVNPGPTMTPEQIAAFMAQQVPAQAPAAAEPPKPGPISQQAWDAMPLQTKIDVAKTMSTVPTTGF